MSGSRPQHLQRRIGTFHLRVRVPNDLRARVGLLEVRRSLRVHTLAEARPLALALAARVLEIFDVLKQVTLSKEDSRALIDAAFADLHQQADGGYVPATSEPDLEVEEQRCLAQERQAEVSAQLETGQFKADIRRSAARLVAGRGIDPKAQPGWVREDLMQGVARAIVEQQRLLIFRLEDRLAVYEPHDPLFKDFGSRTTASLRIGANPGLPAPHSTGPTIGELVEMYVAAKQRDWASKTVANYRRQLGHLVGFFEADRIVATIGPEDMVAFKDAIVRLKVGHHRGPDASFAGRLTDNPAHQIEPKTAALLFETCKGMFRWAESEVKIRSNPAEKIRLLVPKKSNARKSRVPFTADNLKQIFSSTVFRGAKALRRRFEPGEKVFSDAQFWIPLIGFFTGMRLGEIVQLHIGDVNLEGAIPYIDISYAHAGEVGSGEEKHLKSQAAVRKVPLHPDLMTLGFAAFVARRTKQRKGKGRLFFEVGFGADGVPSATFSKWFARFLDNIGLTDPAIVFHSFRHTAEDAFKNGLQHQYVIDRIIGHANDAISAHYGQGVSLETMYEAVKSMKLEVDVLKLVRSPNS
jgi:integrase